MSKTLIENKSAMLKDLKKAVNSLVYSPSLAKQEAAFDALASLNNFLESFEIPKEVKSAKKPKATKPKASKPKATKKPKASKSESMTVSHKEIADALGLKAKSPKPKASKSSSKTGRKAEIEALLSSDKKMKRAERSVLNKELFALLSAERRSSKKSKSKAVRRPKRTSTDGLELTQAKDAIGIGKAKKTKAVALDGSQAMYLEPRKEVLVPEPKARKKAVLEVFTLLDGESPQDAVRRRRIEQEKEQSRLEAEALMSGAPDFGDSPF
tara:strand:- start:1038 stop:1841 length:804 start_codon:yes stop_codon:yes gene_type:complete